jgi:alpha,alpha-trehalose phosphorylase (configuration-retaining)
VGISAVFSDSYTAVVAIAIHDNTYLLDFSVKTISLTQDQDQISDHVLQELQTYEHQNLSKFIGAGIPYDLMKKCPKLCSRLWLELDVVPISIVPDLEGLEMEMKERGYWDVKCVDEQADSMARKCLM